MSGYIGKVTNHPRDVSKSQTNAEREDMFGPIPGEIVSYDAAAGTATIKPLYKPRHNGQPVDMPNLLEVPIQFARGGNSAITHPMPPGTKVQLTPQMRSQENWDVDSDGAANDTRSFHLSDMVATLAGGDSLSDPLPNVDPDNTHIRANADGTFGMKLSPDGKFEIVGTEGNVYKLLAQAIRLIGGDQLQINYGSSAGSGHALQNRAEILAIADKLDAMAL